MDSLEVRQTDVHSRECFRRPFCQCITISTFDLACLKMFDLEGVAIDEDLSNLPRSIDTFARELR